MMSSRRMKALVLAIYWTALLSTSSSRRRSECQDVLTTVTMEVSPVLLSTLCMDNSTTSLIITCQADTWVESVTGFCSSFDLNIGRANMERTLMAPVLTLKIAKGGFVLETAQILVVNAEKLERFEISVWGQHDTRFVLGVRQHCLRRGRRKQLMEGMNRVANSRPTTLLNPTGLPWTAAAAAGDQLHKSASSNFRPKKRFRPRGFHRKKQTPEIPRKIIGNRGERLRSRLLRSDSNRFRSTPASQTSKTRRVTGASNDLGNVGRPGAFSSTPSNSLALAKLQWMEERRIAFEKERQSVWDLSDVPSTTSRQEHIKPNLMSAYENSLEDLMLSKNANPLLLEEDSLLMEKDFSIQDIKDEAITTASVDMLETSDTDISLNPSDFDPLSHGESVPSYGENLPSRGEKLLSHRRNLPSQRGGSRVDKLMSPLDAIAPHGESHDAHFSSASSHPPDEGRSNLSLVDLIFPKTGPFKIVPSSTRPAFHPSSPGIEIAQPVQVNRRTSLKEQVISTSDISTINDLQPSSSQRLLVSTDTETNPPVTARTLEPTPPVLTSSTATNFLFVDTRQDVTTPVQTLAHISNGITPTSTETFPYDQQVSSSIESAIPKIQPIASVNHIAPSYSSSVSTQQSVHFSDPPSDLSKNSMSFVQGDHFVSSYSTSQIALGNTVQPEPFVTNAQRNGLRSSCATCATDARVFHSSPVLPTPVQNIVLTSNAAIVVNVTTPISASFYRPTITVAGLQVLQDASLTASEVISTSSVDHSTSTLITDSPTSSSIVVSSRQDVQTSHTRLSTSDTPPSEPSVPGISHVTPALSLFTTVVDQDASGHSPSSSPHPTRTMQDVLTLQVLPVPSTNDTSESTEDRSDDLDGDTFWPVVAALVIGIPAVIVFGIAITVLRRRRLAQPPHIAVPASSMYPSL